MPLQSLALPVAALFGVLGLIWLIQLIARTRAFAAWLPQAPDSSGRLRLVQSLPLDQKRQRIAWMFRDKPGMAASFGPASGTQPVLLGLVGWLPREDWRPMLAAIGRDDPLLQSLGDAATARGDARLACTFARAAGRDCGVAADGR